MESGAEKKIEDKYGKFITQQKSPKSMQKRNNPKKEASIPYLETNYICKVEPSPPEEGEVAVTDYTRVAYLQDLDDKIKAMMTFSENKTKDGRESARICKVCGKEDKMSNIKNHIEAIHLTGVSHTCDTCGNISKHHRS